MSDLKPDFWGYHIYEGVIGLSIEESEAKEESWRGESHFPLYSEGIVQTLQTQLEEAQKYIEEQRRILQSEALLNTSLYRKNIAIERVILQMATILQDMDLDEWGTDHADRHTLASHECLVEHRDLLNELSSK